MNGNEQEPINHRSRAARSSSSKPADCDYSSCAGRAAPEPPPLPPGAQLVPGYTVLNLLRRSSALTVYEVWSDERDCRCVAKTLSPERRSSRLRERLLIEGRYLQSFAHPHLVRAYEVLDVPVPTVILETLPGQTLGHLIDTQRRPMPARSLVCLGLHLCSAMHYLHRHDVLHLDLKPSNVVCSNGLAKVIDLSLARPPGPVPPGCGTEGYLAPEQARGGTVDPAADVWGIGSVLYESATGARPFQPEDRTGRFPQLQTRAASVRTRRPRLDRNLAAAIDACLEPSPADRPRLPELLLTLDRLIADGLPAATAPHTLPQSPAANRANGVDVKPAVDGAEDWAAVAVAGKTGGRQTDR